MLTFHFLNVGRGDCIIVEYKTQDVHSFGLVDCCRTPNRLSPARDKLIQLGARKLEFVCITHPDADHYTGILDVFEQFDVELFFTFPLGAYLSDKNLFKMMLSNFNQLAKNQDNEAIGNSLYELIKILLKANDQFLKHNRWEQITGNYNLVAPTGFNGVKFIGIMPPAKVKGDFRQALERGEFGGGFSNNELSVGLVIQYAGRQIVLGSDIPGTNWQNYSSWLQRSNISIESELSKVPHHGSKHDCTESFVNLVFGDATDKNLRIAIVSANGTTHPHEEAIKLLHDNEVRTYCTNLPQFFQPNIQRLITDKNRNPEFIALLNLHAESTSRFSQPCQGDISVEIEETGKLNVRTEFSPLCPCSDLFESLTVSA